MRNDPWLEKWMNLLCEKSTGGFLLELGCGSGWDTADLAAAGRSVVAADLAGAKLLECARAVPAAEVLQLDLGKPLPFAAGSVPVIVASLSLHYFSWEVTRQVAAELARCIRPGGVLLARFNSTHDFHHGAGTAEEIEPGFYRVGYGSKRFFDEDSVRRFLQGWEIRFLEENVIHRYKNPKSVWEALAVFGQSHGL